MMIKGVPGNTLRLDGGAMFGNVPKVLWTRWMPSDDLNRVLLATRPLLVQTGMHQLLFEAGTGAYMNPKYRERYGIQESEHVLLTSLAQAGVAHEEVTDVVLSHLHFDHAGGLLSAWREEGTPELLFPNARYYVSGRAWERATRPHYRDRASFVPLLNEQLEQSGRLARLDRDDVLTFGDLEVRFFPSEGHTPGMLCSDLRWNGNRLVFMADLIPGTPWVHLPITMGYDRFPELLIDEKEALLSSLAEEDAWLFYTHDPEVVFSRVRFDEARKTFVAVEGRTDLEDAG